MAETYYAKPENSPVENLTLNSYDALYIANGGTANSTVINAMGSAVVNDGGSANNTTVNQSGTLTLLGGKATGVTVASDGRIETAKGTTVTGIEAAKGAILALTVAPNTEASGTSNGVAFQIQNSFANGFTLETGVLTVENGATAINTILNSAGTLNISSGGKATGTTVSMGGVLKICSSGSAIGATVSMGGKLTVESGGLADAAIVAMGGTLEVVSSTGLATGAVVSGGLVLSSGGKATGTTVAAGGVLNVGTKGVADGADVNGFLNVLEGGLASNVTLNEGAAAYVQCKGTGSDMAVENGAFLEILSGGRLKGMTVYAGGSATIHADVIASNVDIDGGEVTVKSDGMAYQTGVPANTIVENEGLLHIEGGALVEGALVSKFACVDVAENGVLSNATITGATLEVRNGGLVAKLDMKEDAIMYVESGGVLNDIKVSAGAVISGDLSGATGLKFYGGTLDLLIGGRSVEDDFIIDEDSFNSLDTSDSYFLTLSVGEGMEEGTYKLIEKALGFDKSITVKDMFGDGSETIGTLTVGGDAVTYSGFGYTLNLDTAGLTVTATKLPTPDLTGNLDSEAHLTEGMYGSSVNILEGGKLHVSNGGLAEVTAINAGGSMVVSQGGSASDTTVNNGGKLYVSKGGIASKTELNDGGKLFASSGSVGGATVSSGGSMFVSSGATASDINVSSGGFLWIYDGVTATGIVAAKGAELYFNVSPDTYVKGTYAESDFEMKDATLSDFTAWEKCTVAVRSGGVTSNTTLNDGTLQVDGGVAKDTVVKINGDIWLYEKGSVVSGVTFQDGCHLWIRKSGGKLTGKVTFETGAGVTYSDGASATLDFDLTQTTAGADALVNDLAPVLAAPFDYTLTVDGTEVAGDYNLAGGATGFDKTITVKNTLGEDLGTLTVAEGTKELLDNRKYTLALDASDNLSVTIGEIGGGGKDTTKPVVSNIKADITTQTNGNVTVTADFNDNVEVASRLYNFNGGEWQDYDPAAGVVVTENGTTVNFKAVDTSGNESEGANYYTVTNIDKADPTITNIMASTTTPAESVTVTADFADNVELASKQYRIGDGAWQDYDPAAGVTVTTNVTVFFRAVDTAGNKAEDSYEVNNIVAPDTTPPTITISQDTTEPVASVTVTAVFTDDVAVAAQQYRIGDGEWQDYTSPFTVTENGIISFQASDTSGNSVTESWTVTNIVEEEKGKPDNGWNDYLYDKKLGWNDDNIANFADNKVTPEKLLDGNNEIYLDIKGTVVKDGKHNMFGNDGTNKDTGDTAKISVAPPAKLTFSIDSTADGTFYVYEDGKDKKGNRKQIQVGKVAVKKGKTAELKNICLTAGEGKYYVEMVAKNVRKEGAEGFYNVTISNSTFFVDADAQTNNEYQDAAVRELKRGTEGIVFDSAEMNNSPDTKYNSFVGFSDAVDYVKLDLASDSYVSFDLASIGNAKFTLWKYDKAKNKISKISAGCATLKSKNGEVATKTTKAQLLQTIGANGKEYEYYLSMECSDAAKGGGAYYSVEVNATNSRFFDSADNGDNDVLYIKRDKAYKDDANFQEITLTEADKEKAIILDSNTIGDTRYNNFVGFNDTADYAKIVLKQKGSLSFEISALADVTFEIWQKDKDRKGNNVLNSVMKKTAISVKDYSVGNTGKTTAITLDAGEYYISVTAKKTTANEKGSAFYNVTAFFTAEAVINDSLAMPETDSLAMADELGFGQYGTDALADVSAAASLDAGLDSKSAWLNIASLA